MDLLAYFPHRNGRLSPCLKWVSMKWLARSSVFAYAFFTVSGYSFMIGVRPDVSACSCLDCAGTAHFPFYRVCVLICAHTL